MSSATAGTTLQLWFDSAWWRATLLGRDQPSEADLAAAQPPCGSLTLTKPCAEEEFFEAHSERVATDARALAPLAGQEGVEFRRGKRAARGKAPDPAKDAR